jgi:hypothetical protein
VTPFQLSFITDANEKTGPGTTPGTNEASGDNDNDASDDVGAAGTLGFSLGFEQVPCA